MLGICNGFQALIKLGLVPYGKIIDTDAFPTLTYNTIGRHQSRWCARAWPPTSLPGCEHQGRRGLHRAHLPRRGPLPGLEELCEEARRNGQIATQYVDLDGIRHNGCGVQPQRLRLRHRGHHLPRRPRVRQDGAQRAHRAGALPKRARDYDMKLFRSAVRILSEFREE